MGPTTMNPTIGPTTMNTTIVPTMGLQLQAAAGSPLINNINKSVTLNSQTDIVQSKESYLTTQNGLYGECTFLIDNFDTCLQFGFIDENNNTLNTIYLLNNAWVANDNNTSEILTLNTSHTVRVYLDISYAVYYIDNIIVNYVKYDNSKQYKLYIGTTYISKPFTITNINFNIVQNPQILQPTTTLSPLIIEPFQYNLIKSLGNPTILSKQNFILNNATDRVLSDIRLNVQNYSLYLEFILPSIIENSGSIQAGFANNYAVITLIFSKNNIEDYYGNRYAIDTTKVNKIRILSEYNTYTFYVNDIKYSIAGASNITLGSLHADGFNLFFQSNMTTIPYEIKDLNFALCQLKPSTGNAIIINNTTILLSKNPDQIISYPIYDYNKFNFYMECVIDKLSGNDFIGVGFICPSNDFGVECMLIISPNVIVDSFGNTYDNNIFPLKLGLYFSDTNIKYYINNQLYELTNGEHKYPGSFVDIGMQFFAYDLSETITISNINFNAMLK